MVYPAIRRLAAHADTRNVPALGRIGDPDDILGSVLVQDSKVRGVHIEIMHDDVNRSCWNNLIDIGGHVLADAVVQSLHGRWGSKAYRRTGTEAPGRASSSGTRGGDRDSFIGQVSRHGAAIYVHEFRTRSVDGNCTQF